MKQTLAVVTFQGLNLSDPIATIGGLGAPGGITGATLPSVAPQYWLGYDENNNQILCTTKSTFNGPLILTNALGSITATLCGPTVEVDFVGGRPDDRK